MRCSRLLAAVSPSPSNSCDLYLASCRGPAWPCLMRYFLPAIQLSIIQKNPLSVRPRCRASERVCCVNLIERPAQSIAVEGYVDAHRVRVLRMRFGIKACVSAGLHVPTSGWTLSVRIPTWYLRMRGQQKTHELYSCTNQSRAVWCRLCSTDPLHSSTLIEL